MHATIQSEIKYAFTIVLGRGYTKRLFLHKFVSSQERCSVTQKPATTVVLDGFCEICDYDLVTGIPVQKRIRDELRKRTTDIPLARKEYCISIVGVETCTWWDDTIAEEDVATRNPSTAA